jgi:hypothetical protein
MATIEQRVSYIEGKLESLATKDDLIKVVIGLAGLQLLGLAAVAAIMRFVGG